MPRRPKTFRTAMYFVLDAVAAGCTAAEGIETLERLKYKLDMPLPRDGKLTVFQLAERIVQACDSDPVAKQYFDTLYKAAKQAAEYAQRKDLG